MNSKDKVLLFMEGEFVQQCVELKLKMTLNGEKLTLRNNEYYEYYE
jgi:hypothetical protein